MKILIVDDNADDRRVLRYTVEAQGHKVLLAEHGEQGLAMAEQHKPDLIISDALMPVMDGFRFLRNLKQKPSLSDIPFIFYSAAYRENQDVQLALSLGAAGYIIKPIEPPTFWKEVEQILANSKATHRLVSQPAPETSEYFKRYSQVVATKLEEKVRELEWTLEERARAEANLQRALKEREVLIHEIHHRVKNNLQIIISLMQMQANYVTDPVARLAFKENETRVLSMALVHDKLYQSLRLNQIRIAEYMRSLVEELASTKPNVSIELDIPDLSFDIDTAIPCGLILNELIMNTFRYAFPENRSGHIRVQLRTSGTISNASGQPAPIYTLTVSDNGIGLPGHIDPKNSNDPKTLGFRLIAIFVHQLHGTSTYESTDANGTEFSMTFSPVLERAIPAPIVVDGDSHA